MFTKDDLKQIEQRGSSVQTVEEQVERFKKGFPWMNIVAPATPQKGILVLDEAAVEAAAKYYEGAQINGKCKFVPASGTDQFQVEKQYVKAVYCHLLII